MSKQSLTSRRVREAAIRCVYRDNWNSFVWFKEVFFRPVSEHFDSIEVDCQEKPSANLQEPMSVVILANCFGDVKNYLTCQSDINRFSLALSCLCF